MDYGVYTQPSGKIKLRNQRILRLGSQCLNHGYASIPDNVPRQIRSIKCEIADGQLARPTRALRQQVQIWSNANITHVSDTWPQHALHSI